MMQGSGQTINDRINAARYALAGQGLARVVCKATTEEMIAPKRKHIDYLLQCTNEPNVSIPQLANLLIERTAHSSWVVVFKALITVHQLMCYGNERFTQYLASSNSNFQLSNYIDKTGPKGYDMSLFIRRHAKYLNTKALAYRTVAFDFTKIKRGNDGVLKSMSIDKLLKTLPVLQNQLDSLLEFDCQLSDLSNYVIQAAFVLLIKDLIRLFACYNDGIIVTLEKYFEMNNKKQAREALEIYKKFLIRMNKVAEFLKIAEHFISKDEIPDLTKAPSSLLEAMEQHLAALEGKKGTTTTVTPSTNGENAESSRKKAIEEEEQFLSKLKDSGAESEKHQQENKKAVANPFLSLGSPTAGATSSEPKKSDILDLFANDEPAAISKTEAKDDLFSLAPVAADPSAAATNNPFADILNAMNTSMPATAGVGGFNAFPGGPTTNANNFATSDNFAAAFGTSSNSNIAPRDSKNKSADTSPQFTEDGKSPSQDRKVNVAKPAPSRPPPPPSSTKDLSPSTPSRPPPPGEESEAAKAKPKPSRPPAPTGQTPVGSGASTPSTQQPQFVTPQEQMQQFMLMQQQVMQQMMQKGNEGAAPDSTAMMNQMAQMQMMFSAMMNQGGGAAPAMPNMAAMLNSITPAASNPPAAATKETEDIPKVTVAEEVPIPAQSEPPAQEEEPTSESTAAAVEQSSPTAAD